MGSPANYLRAASKPRTLFWKNEDDTCKSESAKQDTLLAESIRTYISEIRKDLFSTESAQFSPLTRTGQYKVMECLFEDLDLFVWRAC